MDTISPKNLILRCYGYRTRNGRWVGVCIDFNLSTEADNPEQLKGKMGEIITSYLETVLDTEDRESIPSLLSRRAPLSDLAAYHLIKFANIISRFREKIIFQELVPFHLAHGC
jgi:hypothetical protein